MLVIVLTMSKQEKKLIAEPDTISRGFVYVRDAEDLIRSVNRVIKEAVSNVDARGRNQWGAIKQEVRKAAGQYIFHQTKRKPMILPIIIEV